MKSLFGLAVTVSIFASGFSFQTRDLLAQGGRHQKDKSRSRVTRLVWKDIKTQELKWSDVFLTDQWEYSVKSIGKFPELNTDEQKLVQMKEVNGVLVVGVRDEQNGEFESGWIGIDTGVRGVSHGFHMDWTFSGAPRTIFEQRDTKQGNPAHLYVYDDYFYLANDQLNGFTQINPETLVSSPRNSFSFYEGGGNHITLAAVKNKVAYSAWIDGGGPNAGRVDVVDVSRNQREKDSYSFHLPTGGIHGAITNAEKVFFAPVEGICWVEADLNLQTKPEEVKIHHLDLGTNSENGKPIRTGAFTNYRNFVLFSAGIADSSALFFLDAEENRPKAFQVPIDVAEGLRLTTPKVVRTKGGRRYVFLFQDRPEGEGEEYLTVIDLDPNQDRNFIDAKVIKTITVGASAVDGHFGHHDIAFDPDRRYAFVTNPGDGTISVVSLKSLEIIYELKVSGTPTSVLAIGGKNHH